MKKLLFFWKELIATFWFVPVLILIFSIFLATGLLTLDTQVTIPREGWIRFFLVNSSDSARSILSTISGAMIGVAGTVFSVTLVALTLASSQFGPRLIKNFMYVRLNQVVLGSYISTYLYCLLVLNAVMSDNDYTFIPSISILVAIFAAISNIILLIVFIHQIAVSIQADKVIADISDFISEQLKILFPEKMGEGVDDEDSIDVSSIISEYKKSATILSPETGYLQYVNSDALVKFLTERDMLLELNHRPGRYLVKGVEIGTLHYNDDFEENDEENILKQFIIGKTKTPQQDLEYSVNQMVQIAARALSPGVNDPYTAIACIDNLTATMCYLAEAKFPSKYRYDEDEHLRIIADVLDFEGILDASFNQIRQYSGGNNAVIIRLMEAMIVIYGFTNINTSKKAVLKHAQMILNIGERTMDEANDIQDLTERSNKILNNN